jgi:Protein of unknown function (DUF3108)
MFRAASFGLLSALVIGPGPAAADQLAARYDILVGGLLVGKASLTGDISDNRYSISLNASMTGLIGAVTGGKGSAVSSGSISGSKITSEGYALNASNGSQTRSIRIGMSGGNAQKPIVAPAFVTSPERAPITDQQRRGVIDPLTALLMPVKGKDPFDKGNCNRTLAVFDGAQRFNVTLSFARMTEVNIKGYQGPVLVCAARYVPLGGHFPKRPQTKFMVDNREMSAWLAPLEGGRVLAPVQINIKTAMGNSMITARSFPGAQDMVPTASTGQ